jgi:plasmid maintenance system killer protein
MNIIFKTGKFKKQCNSKMQLVRAYGSRRAALILQRLDELYAAETLETFRFLPQARCHELKGNYEGLLSVDLDHPYRLLFKPANNPVPRKPDKGLDWSGVTEIEIVGVEDTHG